MSEHELEQITNTQTSINTHTHTQSHKTNDANNPNRREKMHPSVPLGHRPTSQVSDRLSTWAAWPMRRRGEPHRRRIAAWRPTISPTGWKQRPPRPPAVSVASAASEASVVSAASVAGPAASTRCSVILPCGTR